MSDWIWNLENLSIESRGRSRFRTEKLHIPRGITALLGPSGAGKTTLLNLLAGFEKPTLGQIQIHPSMAHKHLFWSPYDLGLWPQHTVKEHLQIVAPVLKDFAPPADELLTQFDLQQVEDERPDRLSQGQRTRLSVARSLATGAPLLLMDEPLGHVEPAMVYRYWDSMIQCVESFGRTLVFSTHDPMTARRYAGHTICLSEGRVIGAGHTESLYEQPPDAKVALCFGETNWIEPMERAIWLEESEVSRAASYRPEQLRIEHCEVSPLLVQHARPGEVELLHEPTGTLRRFFHRGHTALPRGQRVRLRTLAAMLLLALCIGCGHDPNESSRGPDKFTNHTMFADGPNIPAPRDLAPGPDGTMILLDNGGRVMLINDKAQLVRQWRMPSNEHGNPEGSCLLADGRIAVADTHYFRVLFFDQHGKVLSQLGGERGEEAGQFIYPVSIVQDPEGNLYVAEYGGNDRIQKFTVDGKWIASFGGFGTGEGDFQRLSGLVWYDGHVYASDAMGNRIAVFTDEGKFVRSIATDIGMRYPYDIEIGPDKRLYIAEWQGGCVTIIDLNGRFIERFGSPGIEKGQLRTPWGVEVRESGSVWIADTGNYRLVEVHR